MKYIISEDQNEKITKRILKYLDENLTPYEGWKSPQEYDIFLNHDGHELFFFTVGGDPTGDEEHMYYSLCGNPNLVPEPDENSCPLLLIPHNIYTSLNGYFNNLWRPVLMEWFKKHTELSLKYIGSQDWDN